MEINEWLFSKMRSRDSEATETVDFSMVTGSVDIQQGPICSKVLRAEKKATVIFNHDSTFCDVVYGTENEQRRVRRLEE